MKLKIEKEIKWSEVIAFILVFCIALTLGYFIGTTTARDAVREEIRGEIGNLTQQTFVYGADYGASFVLGRQDKLSNRTFNPAGRTHQGYLDGYYNESLKIPIIGE